jgi:DNA-binding LytR/AlgR family response regulator
MRIVIVEDELPAQRLLKKLVTELIPEGKIEAVFTSVNESVEWLNKNPHPDILFLDIQLTDGISFSILEQAKPDSFIIFTTAYDEYAIQAFKANTIDYLLKPIRSDELSSAIDKFKRQVDKYKEQNYQELDLNSIVNGILNAQAQYRERFVLYKGDGWYKVNVKEVALVYIQSKMVSLVDFKGKRHSIELTMEQIMDGLNPNQFFRVNRQIIVNMDAIVKVENRFNGKLVVKTHPEHFEKIIVPREKNRLFKDVWMDR